jgi:hypothetical protein
VKPLPKATGFYKVDAREGDASPSPAPLPLGDEEQNVSGMLPTVHSTGPDARAVGGLARVLSPTKDQGTRKNFLPV